MNARVTHMVKPDDASHSLPLEYLTHTTDMNQQKLIVVIMYLNTLGANPCQCTVNKNCKSNCLWLKQLNKHKNQNLWEEGVKLSDCQISPILGLLLLLSIHFVSLTSIFIYRL